MSEDYCDVLDVGVDICLVVSLMLFYYEYVKVVMEVGVYVFVEKLFTISVV